MRVMYVAMRSSFPSRYDGPAVIKSPSGPRRKVRPRTTPGPVAPGRLALDPDGIHVLHRVQHEDAAEPLPLQAPDGPAELEPLAPNEVRAEGGVEPGLVALQARPLRKVEH